LLALQDERSADRKEKRNRLQAKDSPRGKKRQHSRPAEGRFPIERTRRHVIQLIFREPPGIGRELKGMGPRRRQRVEPKKNTLSAQCGTWAGAHRAMVKKRKGN